MSEYELEKNILELVSGFKRLPLENIVEGAFMDRLDRKYILNEENIGELLKGLEGEYDIVEAANSCASPYNTVYLDTEDYSFYRNHHNGKGFRTKVRYRSYPRTGTHFLEVKRKSNKGRTAKYRLKTDGDKSSLSQEERDFLTDLSQSFKSKELIQTVTVDYQRLAFISKSKEERFSIDFRMKAQRGDAKMSFGRIAVIEVKQYRLHTSTVIARLREMGFFESSMSKYCLSLSVLKPDLKSNNFKPALQRIRKIDHEAIFR